MRIHLNEGQLNRIVKRSVKRAIDEANTGVYKMSFDTNGTIQLLRQAIECIRDHELQEALMRVNNVRSRLEYATSSDATLTPLDSRYL